MEEKMGLEQKMNKTKKKINTARSLIGSDCPRMTYPSKMVLWSLIVVDSLFLLILRSKEKTGLRINMLKPLTSSGLSPH